jgi:outer membrane protein
MINLKFIKQSMKFKAIALALLAVCALGFNSNTQAQHLKIAYVNSSEILDTLPVFDSIQIEIQALSNQWQRKLESFQKELQGFIQYNDANPSSDPEVMAYRQQQLQGIQAKIQETYQKAQQDVAVKEQEMLEPVIKRVKEIITEVAKEKGYDYVLDSSEGGSVIYGVDKYNIIDAVMARLATEDLVSLIK